MPICFICFHITVEILNPMVDDRLYISVWKFFSCFAIGGLGMHFSPYTHTYFCIS